MLEIEVKAYRRIIRRHRYRPTCHCQVLPGIVMAQPPPQLTPRGKLGNSLLVEALLTKYRYGQPTHRLLDQWRDQGLLVAQGTLTERLQHLLPLFEPWRAASLAHLRQAHHWHADETRWEVFEPHQDKASHRWYLWVFQTQYLQTCTLAGGLAPPDLSAFIPWQMERTRLAELHLTWPHPEGQSP